MRYPIIRRSGVDGAPTAADVQAKVGDGMQGCGAVVVHASTSLADERTMAF